MGNYNFKANLLWCVMSHLYRCDYREDTLFKGHF